MKPASPGIAVLLVALIATAAAALVAASWEFSRERIAANERARLLAALSSVLTPDLLARDLEPVPLSVTDADLLGTDEPVDVFVPVEDGEALAAIFASVAPGGYNAPIHLLIGIDMRNGRITGVRVVSHRETPGLGDQIELARSSWIRQFDNRQIGDPPADDWAVRQDDGTFDAITGATVTPRAVVRAVYNTLLYFEANRDELAARAREQALQRDAALTR